MIPVHPTTLHGIRVFVTAQSKVLTAQQMQEQPGKFEIVSDCKAIEK